MKIKIAVGTLLIFSSFQFVYGQVEDFPNFQFPVELQGRSHVIDELKKYPIDSPLKQFTEIKTVAIPLDQSNWARLGFLNPGNGGSNPIKSIHMYGFTNLGGELVDSSIEDPKVLKQFYLGLWHEYVRRPAIGDLTYSFGGGGAPLGVLQFHFEDEPILVGVASHCFYLDVHFGTFRQQFWSLPLAEALKRHLKSEGIELPQDFYEKLSGLDKMRLPAGFEN